MFCAVRLANSSLKKGGTMESNWTFHHMAVVVWDMDKAVEYYQSLDIGTFQAEFMLDSSRFGDYEVYGKTPETVDKTRMRFVQIGSFQIELVQPSQGKPIYKEFLDNQGEGVHHMAFTVDDLDAETAKLVAKGVPVITRAKFPNGGGYAYFDTGKIGHVMTELIQMVQ